MKRIRVVLGAVPKMIDSIIRDVLRDAPDIEIVAANEADDLDEYDVLLLNALEEEASASGYNSPSPSHGIVMVGNEGRKAAVFRRINDELSLESTAHMALEKAITLAAGRS